VFPETILGKRQFIMFYFCIWCCRQKSMGFLFFSYVKMGKLSAVPCAEIVLRMTALTTSVDLLLRMLWLRLE